MAAEGPRPLRSEVLCTGTLRDGTLCNQLLAKEWDRGAYNVVGTTRFHFEYDGRLALICPRCEKKTRLRVASAA